jgi:hypothetical protein
VIDMVKIPVEVEKAVQVAKTAQVLHYVKENQLLTAVCLFVLWQAGAFVSALGYVQGGVC